MSKANIEDALKTLRDKRDERHTEYQSEHLKDKINNTKSKLIFGGLAFKSNV